jgi:hypothetical protein
MIVPTEPTYLDIITNGWALFALFSALIAWILGTHLGAFVVDALVEFGLRPLVDLL